MLKNILNVKGVKTLSKAEQRNVKGGVVATLLKHVAMSVLVD